MSERVFERLERVTYQQRRYHPVGESQVEMAAAMEWVRSLGHEAASLARDGFRYRSVYSEPSEYTGRSTSAWHWAEPGEWLVCMSGDGQDSELDLPHEHPDEDWFADRNEWHETTAATGLSRPNRVSAYPNATDVVLGRNGTIQGSESQ